MSKTASGDGLATIREVAQRAGVSIATVSRALHDGATVRPATLDRIRRAVDEVGYLPNRAASNLRARSSHLLGLTIADIGDPFFTAIARGCEDVVQRHGFTLVIANTAGDPTREVAALYNLAAERVAGVIVSSSGEATEELRRLVHTGIPVVALDRRIESMVLDTVTTDGEASAYAAIEHLLRLGHRRIGVIGGPPEKASTLRERLSGARRALREAGVADDLFRVGDLHEGGGYAATWELLSLEAPPTALFTDNDLTTVGALRALRALRVRIPDQISIIGFGDLPMADLIEPPLTVVAQPTYQMGARAAELLLHRMADPNAPAREVVLMPVLIPRGSTTTPGASTRRSRRRR